MTLSQSNQTTNLKTLRFWRKHNRKIFSVCNYVYHSIYSFCYYSLKTFWQSSEYQLHLRCFHCLKHVFYFRNPLFESRALRGVPNIILLQAAYKRVCISHVPYLSERKLTTINIISTPQDSSKPLAPLVRHWIHGGN